jgi:hypothetical protein
MLEKEFNPSFEQVKAEQKQADEILELLKTGDKQLLKEKLAPKLELLRTKVDLFRDFKKSGKTEDALLIVKSFEKEIQESGEDKLYEMILNGYIEQRNQLIDKYGEFVKKYRGYLGFQTPEEWYNWKKSLATSFEEHENFKNWPTLMKASIIIGQIERLKARIAEAEKLEQFGKK